MKRLLALALLTLALPALAASTALSESGCTATVTLVCTASQPPVTPPVTPPTPSGGCSTSANVVAPWTGYQSPLNLSAGGTVAVPINVAAYPMASSAYHAAIVESPNTWGAGLLFTISKCPGDFTPTGPCTRSTEAWGGSIDFVVGTAGGRNAGNVCQLPAGTNPVYFNVRPVGCPSGKVCQFYFNLSR